MSTFERTQKEATTFLSRWLDAGFARITEVTSSHRSLSITLFRGSQLLIITCGYPEFIKGSFEWPNPDFKVEQLYWEREHENLIRLYDEAAGFEMICHSLKFVERL